MLESRTRVGVVAKGKQEEQNSQRAKNKLQGTVQPEGADEHDTCKQSPHGKIGGHGGFIRRRGPIQFRQDNQSYEGKPE